MKQPKYLSYTYYYNIKRKKTKGVSSKSIEQRKIDSMLIDFYKNELKISERLYLFAKKHLTELRDKELERDKELHELYWLKGLKV